MEQQTEQKNKLSQFWGWLWHSDSVWSWIIALAIAFISVKFIFFPALSFLLGTSLPLVVVESSSMEHPNSLTGGIIGGITGGVVADSDDFKEWWKEKGGWYEERGIEKQETKSWPLKTGFDKGDIMIVYGRYKPKVGDVIIFEANTKHPIIHRIVSIKNEIIETKGDNNEDQLTVEKNISKDDLVGKAVFKIPKLGWLKLIFVEIINLFTR